MPVALPKPGKENPPLVFADGFNEAPPPKIEPFEGFNGVVLPKIDVAEFPAKFPKIDGLLSYWDDTFDAGAGDSPDGFSPLDVCFCNCGWDFSGFVKENFRFSLELNGVLDAETVEGV